MLAAAAEPAASDKVMVLHDCHPPCPVMLRFTLCAGTTVHADHCMTGKSEGCGECANAQTRGLRPYSQAIAPSSHVEEGVRAEHRGGQQGGLRNGGWMAATNIMLRGASWQLLCPPSSCLSPMWVQHVAGGGFLQDLLPLLHQGQECAQAVLEGRRVPGGRGAKTLIAVHVQRSTCSPAGQQPHLRVTVIKDTRLSDERCCTAACSLLPTAGSENRW